MAYSATVTVTHIGGRDYHILITETDAAAASEATISGLPVKGRLLSQLADKTAGDAATIDPILTTSTGSTASTHVVLENDTAAATISNLADPAVPYYSSNGTLFHKSNSASGTNNSITTVYFLQAGW